MHTKISKKALVLLCLLVLWSSCVSFLGGDKSFERKSEVHASGMIAAAYMGTDLSGVKFGLSQFQTEDMIYDGIGDLDDPTSAVYLIYTASQHPDSSVYSTRNQQLGLQGWILYGIARVCRVLHIPPQVCFLGCRFLMTLLFVAAATAIAFQLKKAYNSLFALVFYIVTVFSPAFFDFAPNLYWMPFSWLLPMLVGLLILNHPEKRWGLYPLMFLSIALKSSFGYEYIPNVMLGAILFLFVEWLCCLKSDRKRSSLLFKTLWGVGISCLLGFAAVLLLNAFLRGDGSLSDGLMKIYHEDVIRRTFGNAADYDAAVAGSLNASLLNVVFKYLFLSDISLMSTGLLAVDLLLLLKRRREPGTGHDTLLLICSHVFCFSWFVLAKSHAYIHRFSDVMLLLPFLQAALYLLVKHLAALCPRQVRTLFSAGKTVEQDSKE